MELIKKATEYCKIHHVPLLLPAAMVGVLTVGAVTSWQLNTCSEKRYEQTSEFKKQKSELEQQIKQNSPFNEVDISTDFTNNQDWQWHNKEFAATRLSPTNVLLYENGQFLISKEKKQEQPIQKELDINKDYVFVLDIDRKGYPDIYWIDTKLNLRKLNNSDGELYEQGTIYDLNPYFRSLPKHMQIGDINGDKKIDIIYNSTATVGKIEKEVIKVLYGKLDKTLEGKTPIYYVGDKKLRGMLLTDFNADRVSDLILNFKNNKQVNLENRLR